MQQGSHFFLIAIQVHKPVPSLYTRGGTFTPGPGQTRFDAYERIVDLIVNEMGFDRYNVTHFQLEPNQL